MQVRVVREFLSTIVSWKTFLVALLVFGFAPGAVLRLIVRAFDRDDPRRDELLAELYAVPRWERPFWVFEQLEVALFEGIAARLSAQVKVYFQHKRRQEYSYRIFEIDDLLIRQSLGLRGNRLKEVLIVRPDERARRIKLSRRVPRVFSSAPKRESD